MSFSYGELGGRGNGYAGGLGELGTGFGGLRLRLRARAPAVMRVLHRAELLYEEHLPREIVLELGAGFVPVVISYGRGASGGGAPGLTLLFNGTARLRGLPVAAWAPRPSWRFGFGARSGGGASRQAVRHLSLRTGALTGEEPRVAAPLTLTFNAQQYASTAPAFEYYGAPTVSSITPTSGPRDGGTQLLVAGRHLVGGSAYRCAIAPGWLPQPASPQPDDAQVFEPQQAASLAMPLVHCTTPPADAATEMVTPQLSLNRLDYTNNTGVRFRYYDPPRLLALSVAQPPQPLSLPLGLRVRRACARGGAPRFPPVPRARCLVASGLVALHPTALAPCSLHSLAVSPARSPEPPWR